MSRHKNFSRNIKFLLKTFFVPQHFCDIMYEKVWQPHEHATQLAWTCLTTWNILKPLMWGMCGLSHETPPHPPPGGGGGGRFSLAYACKARLVSSLGFRASRLALLLFRFTFVCGGSKWCAAVVRLGPHDGEELRRWRYLGWFYLPRGASRQVFQDKRTYSKEWNCIKKYKYSKVFLGSRHARQACVAPRVFCTDTCEFMRRWPGYTEVGEREGVAWKTGFRENPVFPEYTSKAD